MRFDWQQQQQYEINFKINTISAKQTKNQLLYIPQESSRVPVAYSYAKNLI